jgi:hypothetical protein
MNVRPQKNTEMRKLFVRASHQRSAVLRGLSSAIPIRRESSQTLLRRTCLSRARLAQVLDSTICRIALAGTRTCELGNRRTRPRW